MSFADHGAPGVARERVALIGVQTPASEPCFEPALAELRLLVDTAGGEVVAELSQQRRTVDPGAYLGTGKCEELKALCEMLDVDTVAADDDLKPSQARKLEQILDRKVVDRSEVILDIFAQHARTRQAQVQVEVAQLEYTLPRLKRMWTHLERFRGGIGMRGPGERQIETDRRLLRKRLQTLKAELSSIDARRVSQIDHRRELPSASLVGYTNAGKSTLMQALTGREVFIADQLFATLDTKTHVCELSGGAKFLLSDTVGFVRKLPHHLVASFHATLEETIHADLLIHVVDASHPDCRGQVDAVQRVLDSLGCQGREMLYVFNKADRIEDQSLLVPLLAAFPRNVSVSARFGQGMEALSTLLDTWVAGRQVEFVIEDSAGNGRLWSYLDQHGVVLEKTYDGSRARYRVRLDPAHLGEVKRRYRGPLGMPPVPDPSPAQV